MAVATCRCRTAPQYHASGHWNRNTRRQTSVPFLPFTRSRRLADCANRARRNVTFAAYSAGLFLKSDCRVGPRGHRGEGSIIHFIKRERRGFSSKKLICAYARVSCARLGSLGERLSKLRVAATRKQRLFGAPSFQRVQDFFRADR